MTRRHLGRPRLAARRFPPWSAALGVALAITLLLTGCSGGGGGPGDPAGPTVTAVILEPADATGQVPTALEITFSTEHAVETTLTLATLDGTTIDGEFSEEGAGWLPASQLEYETTYVATLTAIGANGDNAITTSTFTTMPEPEQTVQVFSFIGPDSVVGVAMPLRIEFKDDHNGLWEIPEEDRAAVERRLSVRVDPPQEGAWHWVSGAEVHYRPREWWQAGSQINLRAGVGGLPVGDGWYLGNDLNVNLSVGPSVVMAVDNHLKTMTVEIDDTVERTFPVSLGRADWPSSSGIHVIMEKLPETVFDTRAEMGEDGYVVDIEFAMRLTYQGEFIHATVRSGEGLGEENVTHGCINMHRDDVEWLFEQTHRWGDPVIVIGTDRQVELGNGWTDWNLDWEDYQRGSALYER